MLRGWPSPWTTTCSSLCHVALNAPQCFCCVPRVDACGALDREGLAACLDYVLFPMLFLVDSIVQTRSLPGTCRRVIDDNSSIVVKAAFRDHPPDLCLLQGTTHGTAIASAWRLLLGTFASFSASEALFERPRRQASLLPGGTVRSRVGVQSPISEVSQFFRLYIGEAPPGERSAKDPPFPAAASDTAAEAALATLAALLERVPLESPETLASLLERLLRVALLPRGAASEEVWFTSSWNGCFDRLPLQEFVQHNSCQHRALCQSCQTRIGQCCFPPRVHCGQFCWRGRAQTCHAGKMNDRDAVCKVPGACEQVRSGGLAVIVAALRAAAAIPPPEPGFIDISAAAALRDPANAPLLGHLGSVFLQVLGIPFLQVPGIPLLQISLFKRAVQHKENFMSGQLRRRRGPLPVRCCPSAGPPTL